VFQKVHRLFSKRVHQYFPVLLSVLWLFSLNAVSAATLEHKDQQAVLKWLQQYQPTVLHAKQSTSFSNFIKQIANKDVVLVGEIHDRYDHHLTQLAILKSLHEHNPKVALGVEWFQQSFQPVIDDYLAGRIDEATLLSRSEYYERWRYDYRMLRPLMQYAKANQIPVIALNAPMELTKKISKGGLEALSPTERAQLPQTIAPANEAYRSRLKQIFTQHMGSDKAKLENFLTVQRVWDATMAHNISRFLKQHSDWQMIALTGSGHIMHGNGIPQDLAQQNPNLKIATVISGTAGDVQAGLVNYVVQTQPLDLPPTGKLGVMLDQTPSGVLIKALLPKGSALQVGLQKQDRILSLNNQSIQTISQLLQQLSQFAPKDVINLEIARTGQSKPLRYRVTLQ
jgi:uncharacterized iron-regulated protein